MHLASERRGSQMHLLARGLLRRKTDVLKRSSNPARRLFGDTVAESQRFNSDSIKPPRGHCTCWQKIPLSRIAVPTMRRHLIPTLEVLPREKSFLKFIDHNLIRAKNPQVALRQYKSCHNKAYSHDRGKNYRAFPSAGLINRNDHHFYDHSKSQ